MSGGAWQGGHLGAPEEGAVAGADGSGRERVSAIILTLDEEEVVARCVREASWADEVLVLDCGSTDRTCDLARAEGARVEHQPWLGWSAQRNAGAALAAHDWVFFLEADEVLDHTMRSGVLGVLSSAPRPQDAWAVDRRDEFWGQLLPPSQRASKSITRIRLYHRGSSSWDEQMLVHEQVLVSGRRRMLPGVLLHWRIQDVADNAERIGRYSRVEAQALSARGVAPSLPRLVLLPLVRFAWLYAVKGYYREGVRGYVNAVMRAHADFLRLAQHWGTSTALTHVDPPEELVRR